MGTLWPLARTPGTALPWGLRGGKARAGGLGVLANSGPQAKEKELDFGNVLVDNQQSRLLVLHNEGNCALDYRLFLEQHSPESIGDDPLGTGLSWG